MKEGDDGAPAGRHRLAASLRRLRVGTGRSADEVAAHLDCSPDRFERMETGMAVIRLTEVRGLLDLYGISGDQRTELLEYARLARERCWWRPYSDLIDESFETLLILEDEALSVRTYQPNLVPGLLQTERYAWELIGTQSDLPLDAVQRQASLRAMRKTVLARDDAPRLSVILDEAALRRAVGPAAVMREQYGHLAEIAGNPGVSIQVLPFKAGPHRALGLGFHIYELSSPTPTVVELELLDRLHFAAEPGEAEHYATAFEQAARSALDAERSGELLSELALHG